MMGDLIAVYGFDYPTVAAMTDEQVCLYLASRTTEVRQKIFGLHF